MSQPLFITSESEKAESQRKTFKGIGCSAGALAIFGPFILGWQTIGLVPVFIITGFVFMFLGIAARKRRDRALLAEAPAINTPQSNANAQAASTLNADAKLNERLNKAKRAGF